MAASVWRGASVGNRGTYCTAMRGTTVPVELLTGRRRYAWSRRSRAIRREPRARSQPESVGRSWMIGVRAARKTGFGAHRRVTLKEAPNPVLRRRFARPAPRDSTDSGSMATGPRRWPPHAGEHPAVGPRIERRPVGGWARRRCSTAFRASSPRLPRGYRACGARHRHPPQPAPAGARAPHRAPSTGGPARTARPRNRRAGGSHAPCARRRR